MSVHVRKYGILLHVLLMAVFEHTAGDSVGIRSPPVATTVSTNETALFTCEVRGAGVNWCINATCANEGPLPNTTSTTTRRPANGTFYSELHVQVPLYYNNSLVKCCVVQSSSVCSQEVTLTVKCKQHVSPTESGSGKETRLSIDITSTTAVTAHTWILPTESPKANSTHRFTAPNNSWLAALSAPLVLVVLVLGIIGVCNKKCRKGNKAQYSMSRRSEDIEHGKHKEDSGEEEMEATTSMEDVAMAEHEEASNTALLTHNKLARRMSWPTHRANRRATDEYLPRQSGDIPESSLNHNPVFFLNQLSGDQAITVHGTPNAGSEAVLNISKMERGGPSREKQMCVFNQLSQLREEFSRGHKRVFSCPSHYIRPSVEKSQIVHGNTEYSSMHKPL